MVVERWKWFSCAAAVALLAAGCFGGASNSDDPPVQSAEGPQTLSSSPRAPDVYWVMLETTKGDVPIEVHRDWSPHGADRFYELVQNQFFDNCRLFRVVEGFVVQTGIAANPQVNARWSNKNIPDDSFAYGDRHRQSNARGTIAFGTTGRPNSRSTQFFISCGDNSRLDQMGFTPFGKVLGSLAVVDSFYGGYGEEPQRSSDRIEAEGNAYLDSAFPKLDTIKRAVLLSKQPELPKQPAE